jgi:hypothetical protein
MSVVSIGDFPLCIFGLVSEYLQTISLVNEVKRLNCLNVVEYQRKENFWSWRNFLNSSKTFLEAKIEYGYYNLNVIYSLMYMGYKESCLYKEFESYLYKEFEFCFYKQAFETKIVPSPFVSNSQEWLAKLVSITKDPSRQLLLTIDIPPRLPSLCDEHLLLWLNFLGSSSTKIQSVHGVVWKTCDALLDFNIYQKLTYLQFDKGIEFFSGYSLWNVKVLCIRVHRNKELLLFSNCVELDLTGSIEVTDVSSLSNVSKLILSGCSNVRDVSPLKNAKYLDLTECNSIEDVSMLTNVRTLILTNCTKITDISNLTSVSYLDIVGLTDLRKEECFLHDTRSLKTICCSDVSLHLIGDLANQQNIHFVLSSKGRVYQCEEDEAIEDFQYEVISQEYLQGFYKLTLFEYCKFYELDNLVLLEELTIKRCVVNGISHLKSLKKLRLENQSGKLLNNIIYETLPALRSLTLQGTGYDAHYFYVMPPLQEVYLSNCCFMKIALLTSLKIFEYKNSRNMNSVSIQFCGHKIERIEQIKSPHFLLEDWKISFR